MEAKFARFLDRYEIKWIFEPKRFLLKNRSYLPDFYLPELGIWIECKGEDRENEFITKDAPQFVDVLKKMKKKENFIVIGGNTIATWSIMFGSFDDYEIGNSAYIATCPKCKTANILTAEETNQCKKCSWWDGDIGHWPRPIHDIEDCLRGDVMFNTSPKKHIFLPNNDLGNDDFENER